MEILLHDGEEIGPQSHSVMDQMQCLQLSDEPGAKVLSHTTGHGRQARDPVARRVCGEHGPDRGRSRSRAPAPAVGAPPCPPASSGSAEGAQSDHVIPASRVLDGGLAVGAALRLVRGGVCSVGSSLLIPSRRSFCLICNGR